LSRREYSEASGKARCGSPAAGRKTPRYHIADLSSRSDAERLLDWSERILTAKTLESVLQSRRCNG
jgi:hypothetical protein